MPQLVLEALQGAGAAACQPGGADALLAFQTVQVAASANLARLRHLAAQYTLHG